MRRSRLISTSMPALFLLMPLVCFSAGVEVTRHAAKQQPVQKAVFSKKISFGWPIDSFVLQIKPLPAEHNVLLTFENCCYYQHPVNQQADLHFLADGQDILIGKPVSYEKKGVSRYAMERFAYQVPMRTFKSLVRSNQLIGFMGGKSFQFRSKQFGILRQFSAAIL